MTRKICLHKELKTNVFNNDMIILHIRQKWNTINYRNSFNKRAQARCNSMGESIMMYNVLKVKGKLKIIS